MKIIQHNLNLEDVIELSRMLLRDLYNVTNLLCICTVYVLRLYTLIMWSLGVYVARSSSPSVLPAPAGSSTEADVSLYVAGGPGAKCRPV